MVRNNGKQVTNGESKGNEVEDDIDALFRLPLAEFIGARKTLAARLKQGGRANEVDRVKALVKPPVSAWAVNQLYWKHRAAFDRLMAAGQRFRQAQTSKQAAKGTDMRGALDTRREALAHLSDLAAELLRNAGHNPNLDTIRRITSTLEALSAYASVPGGPSPGRLTQDVDPPGFESLASLISGGGMMQAIKATPSQKSGSVATKTAPVADERPARLAAAKVSLQDAKRELNEAQAVLKSVEAKRKKTDAEAKESEKQRREAEQRLEKAKAASDDAARRARTVAAEVEDSRRAVEVAKRIVDKASDELESLLRESASK
jgi:hypothetical protein